LPDFRIWSHPILEFKRGRKVTFYFNGTPISAFEGETVAAALYASGIRVIREGAVGPEGVFCMIGKCSTCLVTVNGVPHVRACREPVREGLVVESEPDRPPLPPAFSDTLPPLERVDTDVLVIGAGPAGLLAAISAAEAGLDVVLVDEHFKAGGQLVKQTHKFFGSGELFGGLRGFQIAELLEKRAREAGVRILLRTVAYGWFRGNVVMMASPERRYEARYKAIIVSTGAHERFLAFPGNTLPGVMGAGAAQTLMNEYGVRPGRRALIVGAGNVGLIVAYQLLQAGVEVAAVVEIMREIGGWFVHAAKLRRYGVPILTGHTIVEARGKGWVEEAVIAPVGDDMRPLLEKARTVKCDLVLLAVGLVPDSRLLSEMGADVVWVPELGGPVPLRDRYMETSIPGVYVAGDAGGIEEATTAMLTGRIAGLSAAIRVLGPRPELVRRREEALGMLEECRRTRFSERVLRGLAKVAR